MSYIMLVDARGVIINLAHEMRQNTERLGSLELQNI